MPPCSHLCFALSAAALASPFDAQATGKCTAGFGAQVVKGIFANWLVCLAVFLATSASDMTGKMVGIWFPISAFVAMGMEHSVANMFLIPAGILAGAPHLPW